MPESKIVDMQSNTDDCMLRKQGRMTTCELGRSARVITGISAAKGKARTLAAAQRPHSPVQSDAGREPGGAGSGSGPSARGRDRSTPPPATANGTGASDYDVDLRLRVGTRTSRIITSPLTPLSDCGVLGHLHARTRKWQATTATNPNDR